MLHFPRNPTWTLVSCTFSQLISWHHVHNGRSPKPTLQPQPHREPQQTHAVLHALVARHISRHTKGCGFSSILGDGGHMRFAFVIRADDTRFCLDISLPFSLGLGLTIFTLLWLLLCASDTCSPISSRSAFSIYPFYVRTIKFNPM